MWRSWDCASTTRPSLPFRQRISSLFLESEARGVGAVLRAGGLDLNHPAEFALKFYSFATGKATLLRQFPDDTRIETLSTALTVSPDGLWILYPQFDQAGSDLMLVEDFR
jgi:hypothetical protein